MRRVLFWMILMTASAAAAATTTKALAAQAPPHCPTYTSQSFSLKELTELIRNEDCQVKTLDDVLAVLPERMRSRMALFFRSQSLQGPHKVDYIFPRAILSSVQGQSSGLPLFEPSLMLSFNGHPSQPGFERLEVVDLNPFAGSDSVFNYHEINFPKESAVGLQSWSEVQSKIEISEANPQKCVQCHGIPARPIFQQYPTWEGAYGSSHSSALTDVEKAGLQSFIEKHSTDATSRYRHLNPQRLGKFGPVVEVPGIDDLLSFDYAAQTRKINEQLSSFNGLRVLKTVKALPFYESFKFAFVASNYECANPQSFFTATVLTKLETNIDQIHHFSSASGKEQSQRKFVELIKPENRGGTGSHRSFRNANSECASDGQDCLANFQRFWQDDPILIGLGVDSMEKQGYNRMSPVEAAILRLMFEGQGVSIATWWMDLRQPTYRANNGTAPGFGVLLPTLDATIPKFTEGSEEGRQRYCENLRMLSRNAMETYEVPDQLPPLPPTPVPGKLPAVFLKTCAKCHVEQEVGPRIPFTHESELADWLKVRSNFNKIQYRVFEAKEGESMPPTRALTEDELRQINDYLVHFQ
jgi:hypothetical protein